MSAPRKSLVPGILLIVLGIIFFLPNFTSIRMQELWPFFILGLGVYFFILFFTDRNNFGVLMPASVLTVIGLLFFYCAMTGWEAMAALWPFFIIGPGIGFFLMYALGRKERGLLYPAFIVTGVGCIFLMGTAGFADFWPVILIIVGALMLLPTKTVN